MRSRVTPNSRPTSSSVRAWPSSRPNRSRTTCLLPLDQLVERLDHGVVRSIACGAHSRRERRPRSSSMKSARLESSSSPTGESSDSGSSDDAQDLPHTIGGQAGLRRPAPRPSARARAPGAIWRWITRDPVHALDHVDRDADRAGLVGDGAGDGLADPPRGVGGELEALGVVELLDRPHQAEVALLDQVEERASRGRRTAWRSTRRGGGWPGSARSWRSSPSVTHGRCSWRRLDLEPAACRSQSFDAAADAGLDALRERRSSSAVEQGRDRSPSGTCAPGRTCRHWSRCGRAGRQQTGRSLGRPTARGSSGGATDHGR